nr:YceI family protein [Streptomyces sp. NBC_00886]
MTVAVETGVWQLDQAASTVGIAHKGMWGLIKVKGTFGVISGQGEVRPDGSAVGTLTLDAASLDTKNAKRDEHLRSADLFNVEKFPEITFAVRSTEPRDGDTAHVVGQLTVLGVSRPQTFTARLTGASAEALTLEAEFTVDKNQFGMTWNQMGMLRGLTTVTATLRFLRTAA